MYVPTKIYYLKSREAPVTLLGPMLIFLTKTGSLGEGPKDLNLGFMFGPLRLEEH